MHPRDFHMDVTWRDLVSRIASAENRLQAAVSDESRESATQALHELQQQLADPEAILADPNLRAWSS
jgi:hypothetical protein